MKVLGRLPSLLATLLCVLTLSLVGCRQYPTGLRVWIGADPVIAPRIKMVRIKVFNPPSNPTATEQREVTLVAADAGVPGIRFTFSTLVLAKSASDRVRIDAEGYDTVAPGPNARPIVTARLISAFIPGQIPQPRMYFYGSCAMNGGVTCAAEQTCNAAGMCESAIIDPNTTPPVIGEMDVIEPPLDAYRPNEAGNNCIATSSTETCDGIDNNCNGMTDEGLPMITCGVGACSNTIYSCENGQTAVCTARAASAEICDGLDNNCNGQTDEAAAINTDPAKPTCRTIGACAGAMPACGGTARWYCNYNPSLAEVNTMTRTLNTREAKCDGIDGDCDGMTDEDFRTGTTALGAACSSTQGACTLNGVYRCTANGAATECSVRVMVGSDICDGIDNDCNGVTDDPSMIANDPARPTCLTMGACAGSAPTCTAGTWDCSYSADVERDPMNRTRTVAVETRCDNRDNNCNGITDADNPAYANKGQACNNSMLGECRRSGTFQCNTARDATACAFTNTTPPMSRAELCNGLDDDCNGATDEANPQGNQNCPTGMPGICAVGRTNCMNGTLQCQQTVTARAEQCNNADDDCNGTTDDMVPGVGLSCPTSFPGVCAAGRTRCDSAVPAIVCDPLITPGTRTEICDSMDNDCDGMIDETADVGTQTCFPGTPCQRTQSNCTPCGTPGGAAETCNGIDDNCNGSVDEGVSYMAVANASSPVQCRMLAGCGVATNCCINLQSRCNAGFYDLNTQCGDGCECQDTGGGSTCAAATGVPVVNNGTVSGTIPQNGQEDWYSFLPTAAPSRFQGAAWFYDVTLTQGTTDYTIDVFRADAINCGALAASDYSCPAIDEHSWRMADNHPLPPSQFTNDRPFSGKMYVRVRRRASASTTICLPYTIRFSFTN